MSPISAITVSFDWHGAHAREEIAIAGQRDTLLPRDLEIARRLDRIPLALSDDADEIAKAHDARRYVGDRCLVDMERLGTRSVGALTARTHHAAMPHAGNSHVLHVRVFPGDLVGNIDARHPRADQPIATSRLLRSSAGEFDMERLIADELAIGDRTR